MIDAWPPTWPPLDRLQMMARDIVPNDLAAEYVLDHTIDRALIRPPDSDRNVGGWFRTTMVNASIDWMRANNTVRVRSLDTSPGASDAVTTLAGPATALDSALTDGAETLEQLRDELDDLPQFQREVLQLFYWEGATLAAIARRFDCSQSKVERAKSSGVAKLRSRLSEDGARHYHSLAGLVCAGGTLQQVIESPVPFSLPELPAATHPAATHPAGLASGTWSSLTGKSLMLLAAVTVAVLSVGAAAFSQLAHAGNDGGAWPDDTVERPGDATPEGVPASGGEPPPLPSFGSAVSARSDANSALDSGPLVDAVEASESAGSSEEETSEPAMAGEISTFDYRVTVNGEVLRDTIFGIRELSASGQWVRVPSDQVTTETLEDGRVSCSFPLSSKERRVTISSATWNFRIHFDETFGAFPQFDPFDLQLAERTFEIPIEFRTDSEWSSNKAPSAACAAVTELGSGVMFIAHPTAECVRRQIEDNEPYLDPPYDGTLTFKGATTQDAVIRFGAPVVAAHQWKAIPATEVTTSGESADSERDPSDRDTVDGEDGLDGP